MDLQPGEEIVFEGHRSWRAILGFYVLAIVAVVVLGVLVGLVAGTIPGVVVVVGGMPLVHIVGLVKGMETRYMVTNQRLRIRRGLLSRRVQQTRLDRVQNVNTSQSLLDRVLRVGNGRLRHGGLGRQRVRLPRHRQPRCGGGRRRPGRARGHARALSGRTQTAMARCFGDGDPLYERYHDEEWGRPVTDERGLFERMSLEAFQSGLSWLTILRKREAFRAAFAGFDPDAVAAFGDADVQRLMSDAGIVRNRAKIEATLANAHATVALRDAGTPLAEVIAAHRPAPRPAPRTMGRRALPDAGDRRAGARAQAPRLPFRRADHALRAHAGVRPGQRPPDRLSGSRDIQRGAWSHPMTVPTYNSQG